MSMRRKMPSPGEFYWTRKLLSSTNKWYMIKPKKTIHTSNPLFSWPFIHSFIQH